MNFTISNITTFLKDRKQCVVLYLKERKTPLALTYEDINRFFWQIPVTELELLIGSFVIPEYYEKGAILRNGRIANSSHFHIKTWRFLSNGPEPEVRVQNGRLCLPFTQLYDTHIFARKNRRVVRIRDIKGNICFINLSTFEKILEIREDEFHLLRGAFIAPTFYKAGEISEETFWPVYTDNTILKDLNLRVLNSIDLNYENYGTVKLETKPFHQSNYDYEKGIGMHTENDDYDDYSSHSYEKYNGYNGFDDETIDEAFNGDPEATWNVD